jgi:two-component system, LytTR family, response regulator LytT
MKVVIVEDERIAAERLLTLLKQYDERIEVLACLESIDETVQYLKQHAHPDVLLLDIHLADGHSFEIFKQVNYHRPVIFTTAYDQYALEAFKIFSIDYILKPVTQEALATAFNKLRALPHHITTDFSRLQPLATAARYKKRFVGKVGQRLFFINTENIAFFQADNKIVYLVDHEAKRYVVEYTMEQLSEMLDPRQFFRLNRSFIVGIHAIQQVKPWFNSRLKLSVNGLNGADEMVVSRDRVAEFRQWAEA